MKRLLILGLWVLTGCYSAPDIDGFDIEKWESAIENCTDYRMDKAGEFLDQHSDKIVGLNQNEIKELLGNPSRHQLFNRNQKFFFYSLNCDVTHELRIRYDALGRVKELQVIEAQ